MVVCPSNWGLCCAFPLTHLTRNTVSLPTVCSTQLLFKFFILVISPTGFGCYHLELQGHILLPAGRTSALGALPDSLMTQEHIARLCFMRILPHCCESDSLRPAHRQGTVSVHPTPNAFQDRNNGPLKILIGKSLFIIFGTRKLTYGGRDHHGLPQASGVLKYLAWR